MRTFLSRIFRRREPAQPTALAVTPESWIDFLRAGGTISLAEWATLDEPTRAVLAKAGRLAWVERVAPGSSPWPVAPETMLSRGTR